MNSNTITNHKGCFDKLVQITPDGELEYWYGRDLMPQLGYDRWENFIKVIEKAKTACENAPGIMENHFRDFTKMVDLGSGTKREIDDVILTRYACYLVAQNGDSRNEQIAFAQTYFAVQTRKQEIIKEQIRLQGRLYARHKLTKSEMKLCRNIFIRGVIDSGFGRIRSMVMLFFLTEKPYKL
jgi:DNA-damage-inducible protein D